MKIGILGSRGIPNQYGGFEELAEHLAEGLVAHGHQVTVYNSSRHPYKEKEFKGARIVRIPDPEGWLGTAGQFLYDMMAMWDTRKQKFDVLLQLGYTSSSVWWWLHPRKTKVVTNMDGLEWKRTKYNPLVQRFLRYAETLAVHHSHLLIADNPAIEEYLNEKHKSQVVHIPYGANIPVSPDKEILKDFDLVENEYFLSIARMEPENNWETILKGYMESESAFPFLVIGNMENQFGRKLKKQFDHPGIRFIGPIYDKSVLNSLRFHSRLYFHGHSVGGTNPSLLEAMACSAEICAHKNVFNEAVLGDRGLYFLDSTDVVNAIRTAEPGEQSQRMIRQNLAAIRERYNWPLVVEQYELTMETTLR